VSRQYAGVDGKVDNCQVGVYASLVWQNYTSLINCRLFLPECWSKDSARCLKAGIPEDKRDIKRNLNCLEMPKQTLLRCSFWRVVEMVFMVMDGIKLCC